MSLYNVERPKTFSQVLGQNNVMSMIKAILASGNIPNVSLFVGSHGCGKTTVARLFAKAINCEHPSENGPCNSCAACLEAGGNNSLDVQELDGASNNKVEDIHAIIEDAKYAPLRKYKVYIIDEVHMLSIAAFNALLKLLEEPPKHCVFILCTTEEHKIPATIISRARRFYFGRIHLDIIYSALEKICSNREIPFDENALRIIAKASEGCMRDALSILEVFIDAKNVSEEDVIETLGIAQDEAVFEILESVLSGNSAAAIYQLRSQINRGKDLKNLSKAFLESLTDAACYLGTNDPTLITGTDSYIDSLKNFCGNINNDRVMELLDGFSDIYAAASHNGNDSALEARLISLIGYHSSLSEITTEIIKLKETLEQLEDALFDGEITAYRSDSVSDLGSIKDPKPDAHAETEIDSASHPSASSDWQPSKQTDLPPSEPYDMEILPGDIHLPEGTQVLGTVSMTSFEDSSDMHKETSSFGSEMAENNTEKQIDDFEMFGEMFSAFARQ